MKINKIKPQIFFTIAVFGLLFGHIFSHTLAAQTLPSRTAMKNEPARNLTNLYVEFEYFLQSFIVIDPGNEPTQTNEPTDISTGNPPTGGNGEKTGILLTDLSGNVTIYTLPQ